jgi:hypothetical protein
MHEAAVSLYRLDNILCNRFVMLHKTLLFMVVSGGVRVQ